MSIINPRLTAVTGADIRAVMFGHSVPGVDIVRQAWRTTPDDSDELALIDARGQWWVARRVSDQLTVWAFGGDDEADAGFDRLVAAARDGDHAWREAIAEIPAEPIPTT